MNRVWVSLEWRDRTEARYRSKSTFIVCVQKARLLCDFSTSPVSN